MGLEDDAAQLRIAEQVKIKISRSAIADFRPTRRRVNRLHGSQLKWKFVFHRAGYAGVSFRRDRHAQFPTSVTKVSENLADRIKLGLDFKGGSHLVLQVQVNEAIGQRCDEAVDQLNKELHSKNVNFGEIRRVDDTHILVRNVDPADSGNLARPGQ